VRLLTRCPALRLWKTALLTRGRVANAVARCCAGGRGPSQSPTTGHCMKQVQDLHPSLSTSPMKDHVSRCGPELFRDPRGFGIGELTRCLQPYA